jgi:hypothetical protein
MTVEKQWVAAVQESVFVEEWGALKDGKILTQGKLAQLRVYFDKDDRLLKVGGRLQNADLPEKTIHPIVLPAGNKHGENFILSLHRLYSHPGPEILLYLLRTCYWLLKGRREIKQVIRHCTCYKLCARAFPAPPMEPLPRA